MKKDDFNDIELLDDDNIYEINIPKFDKIEYPNDSLNNDNLDNESEEKSTGIVEKNILQKEESVKTVNKEKMLNNNGGDKHRTILMIIMFIFILLVVYFLPNISDFFNKINNKNIDNSLSSGILKCYLDKDSDEFSYKYESEFSFSNNKLNSLKYSYSIIGDKKEDLEKLEIFNNKCKVLKKQVKELGGVDVSCSLDNYEFTQLQTINYLTIDLNRVTDAYLEAGGMYPNFEKGQNIDSIEKNMKISGYTCSKN